MGVGTALLSALAGGSVVGRTVQALTQKKKADSAPTGTASTPATPQIESTVQQKDEKLARRLGRAALIATSPQGVLTTAPTGRRKLLNN
jgi:hypothetical protein